MRAAVLGDAAIAAIVARRVNFGDQPQGVLLPAIVINTISGLEGVSVDGADGVSTGRVQVDCYAQGYAAARDLGAAVLSLLNGFAGDRLQGVFHAGSRGPTREGGTNEVARPWRVSLDFETTFNMEG